MADRDPFTIALAQYPISRPQSFDVYAAEIERWVEEAAEKGARLLVFPEYGAMEIASIFGRSVEGDLQQQIGSIDCVVAAVDDLHESLARRYGVYILAASLPGAAIRTKS
jgi:predicted amidohydrolase